MTPIRLRLRRIWHVAARHGLKRAALAALLLATPGAATVAAEAGLNLYEATVPGDASGEPRAGVIAEALRQVAVRATGRRAAATDAALAPLYANARHYVQTLKPAAPGFVTVGFDATAVEAQLARAGQPLWDRDRPVTLVLFVPAGGASAVDPAQATAALKKLEQVAQARGVRLKSATRSPSEQLPVRLEDLKHGDAGSLMELARRYGAEEVLVGTLGAGAAEYAAYGRVGLPALPSAPDEALNALVDRLAQDQSLAPGTALATVVVEVAGINDARSYASARHALETLSPVRGVTLTDVNRDVVRLSVSLRGGTEALRHALGSAPHLTLESAAGAEPLRLRLTP